MVTMRFNSHIRALACIWLGMSACAKPTSTGASQDTGGDGAGEKDDVSVTGSVSDDSAVDFVESEDSVQIGGINLVDGGHKVRVVAWQPGDAGGGTRIVVHESVVDGNTFTVSGLPRNKYLFITFDERSATIVPPIATAASITAPFTRATAVAAKIADLVMRDAEAGDATASKVLGDLSISVLSLISSGAVLLETSEDHVAVELKGIAKIHVTETTALVEKLKMSKEDFAKLLSAKAVANVYKEKMTDEALLVFAQVGVIQVAAEVEKAEGTVEGAPAFVDPTLKIAQSLASTHPEVSAAYIASANVAAANAGDLSGPQLPSGISEQLAAETASVYEQVQADPNATTNYHLPPPAPPTSPSPDPPGPSNPADPPAPQSPESPAQPAPPGPSGGGGEGL